MIQRHFPTRINHRIVEAGGILHFGGLIADDLAQDMKGRERHHDPCPGP